jgi:hypothetical protein
MARSERAKSSRNSETGLAPLAVSPERPAPPRQRQRAKPDEAEFVVCKQTIYGYMRAFLRDGVWESSIPPVTAAYRGCGEPALVPTGVLWSAVKDGGGWRDGDHHRG